MNEKPAYDPSSLQLIYSVLLMAQLVITAIVMYVAQDTAGIRFNWDNLNNILIPLTAGVLDSLGRTFWKRGLIRIVQIEEVEEKLKVLTRIHIWQWVMVELGTVLLLTFTLMESNFLYFIFASYFFS